VAARAACAPVSFEATSSGAHVTLSPAGTVRVTDRQTRSFTVTPYANDTTVSAVTGHSSRDAVSSASAGPVGSGGIQ
jgi:hypothetical protein